jgi:hypothetical protein
MGWVLWVLELFFFLSSFVGYGVHLDMENIMVLVTGLDHGSGEDWVW